MKLPNHRVEANHPVTPLEDRLPLRAGAYAKCLPGFGAKDPVGCGTTLLAELDWQLHWCCGNRSSKAALGGFRDEHAVVM